jgi:hypothetical protein
MPMSDKEIAQWQAQGNRRVRATVDSVGRVPMSTKPGAFQSWTPMLKAIGISLIVWILALLWLFVAMPAIRG